MAVRQIVIGPPRHSCGLWVKGGMVFVPKAHSFLGVRSVIFPSRSDRGAGSSFCYTMGSLVEVSDLLFAALARREGVVRSRGAKSSIVR